MPSVKTLEEGAWEAIFGRWVVGVQHEHSSGAWGCTVWTLPPSFDTTNRQTHNAHAGFASAEAAARWAWTVLQARGSHTHVLDSRDFDPIDIFDFQREAN